ncbi:hypothetical protein ACIGNX_24395 [Actinosynnema sp. NPDC053489]|uniref:hypothetical protein n=1 Tax=Actinosynnema sp. NPDC053489 TaxID=3363916 RepID=UPI0037C9DC9F
MYERWTVDRLNGRPMDPTTANNHPTTANNHPATCTHHRGGPWGMAVLTATRTGIARLTAFPDPALVPPP